MSARDEILISLVKEVLGPRNGPTELLPEERDPRSEFITGILEPVTAPRSIEPEDDVDDVIEETTAEEDQDNQGFVATPNVFSPALDPKSLPRSIGLSFTVAGENQIPVIEICATWARYIHETNGWQRNSEGFLTGPVSIDGQDKNWIAGNGVKIQVKARELSAGIWRLSVFLVNITTIEPETRLATEDYLFQPQIRVNCIRDTKLLPVRQIDTGSEMEPEIGSMEYEDRSLEMLYMKRTALARGHMCGVIWREIDPERPSPDFQSPGVAPFAWTDKDTITEEHRARYSPPDVRTELVPCYPIQSPEMAWDYSCGRQPVLSPVELSELWDPTEIHNSLQPLVDGYHSWIEGQENLVQSLPTKYQGVATSNIEKCYQIARRIDEAIALLMRNEDVRLAFCFANKAIAVQSAWKGQILSWRPFQLAFILINIPALSDELHPDRNICDLLWFPTGGGKTEAYLGLSAFVLALRRLQAKQNDFGQDRTGAGVSVLSRYTLRLLTIQQFRRALGVITACEMLRVQNLDRPGTAVGWRPQRCNRNDEFLWGGIRFSTGLWVGGGVTPNNLLSIGPIPFNPGGGGGMVLYAGALDILQGISRNYSGPNQNIVRKVRSATRIEGEGEPAQVMTCPCCKSILAIPREGLGPGNHVLYFAYEGGNAITPELNMLRPSGTSIVMNSVQIYHHPNQHFHTLAISLTIPNREQLTDYQVDDWWNNIISNRLGANSSLISARPSRPGYYILTYDNSLNTAKECDFNIYCPNPECDLNQHAWAEQVPLPRNATNSTNNLLTQPTLGFPPTNQTNRLPILIQDRLDWQIVPKAFQIEDSPGGQRISKRMPIPAYTIDDQVYHRCPSLVIATVDKFARLAFEPKAASLFGNVSHYHSRWGYYRIGCPPSHESLPTQFSEHPPVDTRVGVPRFTPPDLILQDELHLIEGPLGSMVGVYETVVDELCRRNINGQSAIPKYIASTATVRQAETQVQSLFDRRLVQFPPSALTADKRFFATDQEIHQLDNRQSGRLYVAVCAPGKGAQTPIVRIWSALLQSAQDIYQRTQNAEIDPFWTLVGYFNAMRELAGALSLYRQDILQRLDLIAGANQRNLDESRRLELSSRASSQNLPALLSKLDIEFPNAQDTVFATSMFGTGVDINRLSLMFVHGQPKTTAAYIQATGRVGRLSSGLVVSFFRASRPRDLDHYEFFTGYHRALYRYVEPITVAPFSPRARDRTLGPLSVVLLRQANEIRGNSVDQTWRVQQRLSSGYHSEARIMRDQRHNLEVEVIPIVFEERASHQPVGRRPESGITDLETRSELDRWQSIAYANHTPDGFVYNEPTLFRRPSRHVVLGDSGHHGNFREAFENAPQSLREVEETTGFKD